MRKKVVHEKKGMWIWASNLGPKIPFIGVFVFGAMKFSSIIDVLGLNRPSSASFPSIKKGCSIVAFFGLKKIHFVVTFLIFEKGHFVVTFFNSSMPNTYAITIYGQRTLLSTSVVIIPCPTNMRVVDSSSNVVQKIIIC